MRSLCRQPAARSRPPETARMRAERPRRPGLPAARRARRARAERARRGRAREIRRHRPIVEEERARRPARAEARRHAAQPPRQAFERALELHHVEGEIHEHQRRARAVEDRDLRDAAHGPEDQMLDGAAPPSRCGRCQLLTGQAGDPVVQSGREAERRTRVARGEVGGVQIVEAVRDEYVLDGAERSRAPRGRRLPPAAAIRRGGRRRAGERPSSASAASVRRACAGGARSSTDRARPAAAVARSRG